MYYEQTIKVARYYETAELNGAAVWDGSTGRCVAEFRYSPDFPPLLYDALESAKQLAKKLNCEGEQD